MNRQEFVELIKTEYDEFLNHVHRVKAQYSALRELKENHILILLPFSDISRSDISENGSKMRI